MPSWFTLTCARLRSAAIALALLWAPTAAWAQVCPTNRYCYYVPAAFPEPGPPYFSTGWDMVLAASTGTVSGTPLTVGSATAIRPRPPASSASTTIPT